jgi:hypothetical protein
MFRIQDVDIPATAHDKNPVSGDEKIVGVAAGGVVTKARASGGISGFETRREPIGRREPLPVGADGQRKIETKRSGAPNIRDLPGVETSRDDDAAIGHVDYYF